MSELWGISLVAVARFQENHRQHNAAMRAIIPALEAQDRLRILRLIYDPKSKRPKWRRYCRD